MARRDLSPPRRLALELVPGTYAISRLPADAPLPSWSAGGSFLSVTRTPEELSVVCEERLAPRGVRAETGWRLLQVQGPLAFELTGVLASLVGPLAAAGVAVFVVSTFDTDLVLVRERDLRRALDTLRAAGHRVAARVRVRRGARRRTRR